MNKRIIILHDKATGEETPFPSVARLVRKVGKESIGIGEGALYNALCKNKGWYENAKVRVYYKRTEIEPKTWE